jgi:hypothetical protein
MVGVADEAADIQHQAQDHCRQATGNKIKTRASSPGISAVHRTYSLARVCAALWKNNVPHIQIVLKKTPAGDICLLDTTQG